MMETLAMKTCACGKRYTEEQSSGDVCFPCKARSLNWTFVGPTKRTKADFHEKTIKGELDRKKADMERMGTTKDFEPVTNWG